MNMAQAELLKREGLLLRAKGQELVLKSQKLLPSQPPTKPALREYFEELVNLTQVRAHPRPNPKLPSPECYPPFFSLFLSFLLDTIPLTPG